MGLQHFIATLILVTGMLFLALFLASSTFTFTGLSTCPLVLSRLYVMGLSELFGCKKKRQLQL